MRIKRVVIDTNVLISAALLPDSIPARIVDHLLQSATLIFSEQTFAELETRLWRSKFDRYVTADSRRRLLRDLAAIADRVHLPEPTGTAWSRDPDDDAIIHTAMYGDADWLISGDRDLLELSYPFRFSVLSPRQALERWQSASQHPGQSGEGFCCLLER